MSIELSIIVAVHAGVAKLPGLLTRLAEQIGDRQDVEVIVVHGAQEQGVEEACAGYSHVRTLAGSEDALIPHLWRDGIDAAHGKRVALTISHCQPGDGWVDGLLHADLDSYAAVGGSFEPAPDADAMDWAIHLLRYLHFTPPFGARETLDVAGDNAVYDRATLEKYSASYREGFWEPEVHAVMGKDGKRLLVDPSLVSVHDNGYALGEFASQRFRHGTRFGEDRARAMSPTRRWVQLLGGPAVPLVFGAKIVRGSLQRSDTRKHLTKALPYLAVFLGAWSLGELRGTLNVAKEHT